MRTPAEIAFQLTREGHCSLGTLTEEQVFDVLSWLATQPTWNAHVKRYSDGIARMLAETKAIGAPFACHDLEAAVHCPHLLETALEYTDAAWRLFAAEPVLYSMNAWWAFPGHYSPDITTRGWHVDEDDAKQMAIFFYLTDVREPQDGAQQIRLRTGEERTILGPAGTIFATDPGLPHRSLSPVNRARLAAWARFGVSRPPDMYHKDGLYVVKDDPCGRALNADKRHVARFIYQEVPA